ncbi:MAG: hypothetical protein HYT50_00105 [Candidatus Wildermuthbacteria bacterium]|nr:hypothetical protein [Candidatus Wildermuthbacteria bacterium]
MKFNITLKRGSVSAFFREKGYTPLGLDIKTQELVFAKSLSGGLYPRFHIYCKSMPGGFSFAANLHLDQKKPTYQGTSAHSGEYEGQLVEAEAKRIQSSLG